MDDVANDEDWSPLACRLREDRVDQKKLVPIHHLNAAGGHVNRVIADPIHFLGDIRPGRVFKKGQNLT